MSDLPSTVDLSPAESCPPAHIDLNAVDLCAYDAVESVTKGEVVAGLDLEIAYFKTHVTIERFEPLRQA